MTTLRDLIREADDGTSPSQEVADKVIAEILAGHPGIAQALLAGPVSDEVRRMRRNDVRRQEDKAFSHPGGDQPQDTSSDPLAPLRRLASEMIKIPTASGAWDYVRWGDATADQLEARAAWCRQSAIKLVTDAERLEDSARLIRAAGVACLSKVPGFTVRKTARAK